MGSLNGLYKVTNLVGCFETFFFFFWLHKNADLYSKYVTFPKIMLLLKVLTTK